MEQISSDNLGLAGYAGSPRLTAAFHGGRPLSPLGTARCVEGLEVGASGTTGLAIDKCIMRDRPTATSHNPCYVKSDGSGKVSRCSM